MRQNYFGRSHYLKYTVTAEGCGFSIIQQLIWQACYVTLDLCTQLHCYSYLEDFCLRSMLLCHFLKAQTPDHNFERHNVFRNL